MVSTITLIALYITALLAGFAGALLGLGGGVIMVPILDLLFNFDIKNASASSIVAIVGTSLASSSTYVEKRITNVKLALTMSLSAIIGSFVGMFIVLSIGSNVLRVLFGLLLIYVTYYMLKKSEMGKHTLQNNFNSPSALEVKEKYFDEAISKEIFYKPKSIRLSVLLIFLSGLAASMFGIGGGVVNVPVLTLVAGLPLKVAIATSALIILVTSSTSSLLQLKYGYVLPWASGTLFLGTIMGAKIGSKVMNKVKSDTIRKAFVFVLIYTAFRIIIKGLGIPFPL